MASSVRRVATSVGNSNADINAIRQDLITTGLNSWQLINNGLQSEFQSEHTSDARMAMLQQQVTADYAPSPDDPPKYVEKDWFEKLSNFAAGWGDTLTAGLTQRIRPPL